MELYWESVKEKIERAKIFVFLNGGSIGDKKSEGYKKKKYVSLKIRSTELDTTGIDNEFKVPNRGCRETSLKTVAVKGW